MQIKRHTLLLSISLLGSLVCGCGPSDTPSEPVTGKQMIGSYTLKWEPSRGACFGTETLKLKSNQTYQQIFVTTGGKIYRNNGTWALQQNYGDMEIYLTHAGQYSDEWHNRLAAHPQYEDTSFGVFKHGRNISLMVDEDLGLYYRKKL